VPGNLSIKVSDPAPEWGGRVEEMRDVRLQKPGIPVGRVHLADQVSAGAKVSVAACTDQHGVIHHGVIHHGVIHHGVIHHGACVPDPLR